MVDLESTGSAGETWQKSDFAPSDPQLKPISAYNWGDAPSNDDFTTINNKAVSHHFNIEIHFFIKSCYGIQVF